MFIKKTSWLAVIGLFFSVHSGFAIHSTIEDAQQLRSRIIYQPSRQLAHDAVTSKRIILPVSRGFDQKDTCLCWSYAFFSAIETLHRVKQPESKLELSRGAMQYLNMQDRFDLSILGVEDHINPETYRDCWSEGGTPLSADYIIRHYGAATYAAYHDIITPPDYSDIYYSVFTDTSTTQQKKNTASSMLLNYFGQEVPEQIELNDQKMSRLEFVKEILPEGTWHTYAISKDGSDYFGPGKDPDKRRNEITHFVAKNTFINKLKQSLENHRPILYSNDHHVILIYGADFNGKGDITSFYIKDSYESLGYFYQADFQKALNAVLEVTILE